MIRGTYIIHESGICFLSHSYNRESTDIELLSEILVALTQFTKFKIDDDIKEAKLGKHNIIYYIKDTITLAIVTSGKRITKQKQTSIIKKIFNISSNRYQDHLKQEISSPNVFQSFNRFIDNIFHTDFGVEPFLILFSTPIIEKE